MTCINGVWVDNVKFWVLSPRKKGQIREHYFSCPRRVSWTNFMVSRGVNFGHKPVRSFTWDLWMIAQDSNQVKWFEHFKSVWIANLRTHGCKNWTPKIKYIFDTFFGIFGIRSEISWLLHRRFESALWFHTIFTWEWKILNSNKLQRMEVKIFSSR